MKKQALYNKFLPTAHHLVTCRRCGNIEKVAIQIPKMDITLFQEQVGRKGGIKLVPKI